MKRMGWLAASAAAAALTSAMPASALVINLNNTGGVEQGTAAYTGFRAAADFWQSVFTDNITVGLNVGFQNIGSSTIIAQTGSTLITGLSVAGAYNALALDAKTSLDAVTVANQQILVNGGVAVITQKSNPPDINSPTPYGVLQNVKVAGVETVSNREFDADGSLNNTGLRATAANIKAMGFNLNGVVGYTGLDAIITFNNQFNFDLDPTNGIGVGLTDFVGTAIHEIGHALGFTSAVDTYDQNTNFLGNYDNFARATILDLYRFSDNPTGLGGGGVKLDWSVGMSVANGINGRPYISFDGGQTKGLSALGGNSGFFSTGATNGDGRQASHWQDTGYVAAPGDNPMGARCLMPNGPSRGIMDPTFAPCEQGIVTSLDLAAFDAIGWDLNYNVLANINRSFTSGDAIQISLGGVPEPSTWVQMLMGFGLLGMAARTARRRRALVRA